MIQFIKNGIETERNNSHICRDIKESRPHTTMNWVARWIRKIQISKFGKNTTCRMYYPKISQYSKLKGSDTVIHFVPQWHGRSLYKYSWKHDTGIQPCTWPCPKRQIYIMFVIAYEQDMGHHPGTMKYHRRADHGTVKRTGWIWLTPFKFIMGL